MTSDYEHAGLDFDPAPVRIARLEEAIEVVKGLFSDGPCTFTGRHYRIDGLSGSPTPMQRRCP